MALMEKLIIHSNEQQERVRGTSKKSKHGKRAKRVTAANELGGEGVCKDGGCDCLCFVRLELGARVPWSALQPQR